MAKPYKEVTDDEVKAEVKVIFSQCEKIDTDKEANAEVGRLIEEKFGYTGLPPAVTCTSTRHGPSVMRMFMVMMYSPSGDVITIGP